MTGNGRDDEIQHIADDMVEAGTQTPAIHDDAAPSADEPPYPSRMYAWYVVGVLVLAYTFSFIDRQILSLLVVPIRRDLEISDTEMSLLIGFAFALFYTICGLPIGRAVDVQHRVRIIAIGIAFWSVMTALCGVAKTYWQLFLFRMGVGVGEAALSPAAYSILADYFPPDKRGAALGVYGMGVYIGAGLALVIGGIVVSAVSGVEHTILPIVGEVYAWQVVFFVVGLPGLIVALWALTLKEPIRRGHVRKSVDADGNEKVESVPVKDVVAYMSDNARTLFSHHVGYALCAMMAYGVSAWIPTFFIRTHGWTAGEAGIYYGLVVVIFGTAGVVTGGWMADKLTSIGYKDGKLRVLLYGAAAAIPFTVLYPFVESATLAMVLIAPSTFFATFCTGAGPSGVQEIMPNQMRGQASAFMIFVVTIIGLGLGPTAIALVTDFWFADDTMLNVSLAIVATTILVIAVAVIWWGLDSYKASRDYLEDWQRQHEGAA
ncbi:MFS transporter [Pyruvatibacter sp. HU-CL02332]|uniref:spinster family MFS transporter n=1 Tax=Pyruvatibacter sp. HU-CL02332 TaxID=3127650 RepID=UPI003101BC65